MSFDPSNPERPRSTPIPGGSSSFDLPPPTPAEFLGGQPRPQPFGQQPPPLGQQGFGPPGQPGQPGFDPSMFQPTFQVGGSVGGGNPFRWIALVSVLITLAVMGSVGWAIYRAVDDANHAGDDIPTPTFEPVTFPSFSIPEITVATIVPISIPPVSIPPVTVPGDATTVPGEIPTTAPTLDPPTTLPVETVPPTPPSILPNGITSLYDDGAARQVTDQLDAAVGGGPSRFVSIFLYPDIAVGLAQDPANPTQPTVQQWERGQLVPFSGQYQVSTDFAAEAFTSGEVNWEAIAGLAKLAPTYAGVPTGRVAVMVADRVGQGAPPPIVIDILVVDDATGTQYYVEASAAGDLTATGPCPAAQCPSA